MAKRKTSTAAFPNHDDVREIAEIATALGWQGATFARESGGWLILFVDDAGQERRSHSKGVPTTHVRSWIGGATTMKILADKAAKRAKRAKDALSDKAVAKLEDATDADIATEVKARVKRGDIDAGEAFGDMFEPDAKQIKSYAEQHNATCKPRDEVSVFTAPELEAHIADALASSPVFTQAAYLAFESRDVEYDRAALRYTFQREHNVFGGTHAQLSLIGS